MAIIDINKDLAAIFVKQAKETPDLIALEDETTKLTYAELEQETAKLADSLRRDYGVGRDDLVGVLMGRSADYVIACVAALRAGGAFLVLELAYPPVLLADVIEDARPKVVVTRAAHADKIDADVPLIVVDEKTEELANGTCNGHANGRTTEPSPLPADDDVERLAFVSYSSGTTGRPKGIANPHRAPVRSYDLRFALSDLKPGDRVACNVFFVWEILRPLLRGATVVAVPDNASYDPVALVDLLAEKKITETLMTPTLLATVLGRHSKLASRVPDLRTLWLNGEVVTTDISRRVLKALPNLRLLNCYSASETHEIASGDIVEILKDLDCRQSVVPVGPPMDPEHTYIMDESGKKVKDGESGELYVGGGLLAREYLNLPEATAKAFQPDPFSSVPGARMYKTGDIARVLPSGLLEITGRVGGMIKVRGYSIQPPAVEAAIVKNLDIRNCVVVPYGEGLERQIVAYVVRDLEHPGDRTKLLIDSFGYSPLARRALAPHLAHYMIPALWVELDELPTHAVSGKADLKRLPEPKSPATPMTSTPQNKDVKMMTEAWAASLNMAPSLVTEEHNFFDLGGHSLALADLANRLSKIVGVQIPLGPLVADPSLKGHMEVVQAVRDGHVAAVQANLPVVLREDSVLEEDIRPSTPLKMKPIAEANTVLLTGTTGFLGAFILNALLETTSAHIICLVRFTEPMEEHQSAGMARIRKNLIDLGLWNDSILDRIEILPGNLARKRLGLPEEEFEELASRVQVIIHSAATVNLVYPYAALRKSNVDGTREIIRLGCRAEAPVHHISTNGVLPPSHTEKGWTEDSMLSADEVSEKLYDGYGQTKWVAEQLVLEAGKRGLPVRIYRPGTISGHSISGSTNAWDLLNAVVIESLHIGYSPDIDGWRAEMTPVDFVSKAIVTLCDHTDTSKVVYHLGDPTPVLAPKLFEHMAELGYETKPLPFDEWVKTWSQKRGTNFRTGSDDSFTIDILRGGLPSPDALKSVAVLDDSQVAAPALKLYGLEHPQIDSRVLRTYARHFYSRGWLSKSPNRPAKTLTTTKTGLLCGKVAVVTGASSGIGAAVAIAFAREGATVVLGARRLGALELVKSKALIAAQSTGVTAKVVIKQTDVTDKEQVDALFREAGEPDIVVCCAGVMYFTMMSNSKVDEWEKTIDVNCKGFMYSLASAVPGMLSRGKGHFVAISSDAGRKVFPGLGVYSGSKFFVEAALQSLRVETAGSGLKVTAIQPGNTATELLGMSTDEEAIKKYGEPSGAKVLDPEDVARSIVYAVTQPDHVSVNEVLIEPRDEPI
ncbi:Linear gramicidin synthase subunit D [Zalerion maritima]|uniref:Linear gramicidin synthase subunit D n=1 Tax=Zalerion maritima TaxID=339359 RepID=A0AAD5RWP1_9PEZI|nr:Linear gramicidin synthase subunit D [Zalerion maritima]